MRRRGGKRFTLKLFCQPYGGQQAVLAAQAAPRLILLVVTGSGRWWRVTAPSVKTLPVITCSVP